MSAGPDAIVDWRPVGAIRRMPLLASATITSPDEVTASLPALRSSPPLDSVLLEPSAGLTRRILVAVATTRVPSGATAIPRGSSGQRARFATSLRSPVAVSMAATAALPLAPRVHPSAQVPYSVAPEAAMPMRLLPCPVRRSPSRTARWYRCSPGRGVERVQRLTGERQTLRAVLRQLRDRKARRGEREDAGAPPSAET